MIVFHGDYTDEFCLALGATTGMTAQLEEYSSF